MHCQVFASEAGVGIDASDLSIRASDTSVPCQIVQSSQSDESMSLSATVPTLPEAMPLPRLGCGDPAHMHIWKTAHQDEDAIRVKSNPSRSQMTSQEIIPMA